MALSSIVLVLVAAAVLVVAEQLGGFKCDSTAQADAIAAEFTATRLDNSQCPREDWLALMAAADPSSDKILMNVGFNKGYNFAVWMNVFMPWTNVTSAVWLDHICPKEADRVDCCGVCNDCKAEFPAVSTALRVQQQLTFIGVELNARNIDKVGTTMSKLLQERAPSGVRLFTYRTAVSDGPGNLTISSCPFGEEGCSITQHMSRSPGRTSVAMDSIDNLMTRFRSEQPAYLLEHHHEKLASTTDSNRKRYLIDLLMIDVEGNDPLALRGCQQLLEQKNIRAVIFEYHFKLPWGGIALGTVSSGLEQQGFDCYFQGQGRLWPITAGCWSGRYEVHKWSNVMCLQRGDSWHAAVQPLVVRSARISDTAPAALPHKPPTRKWNAENESVAEYLVKRQQHIATRGNLTAHARRQPHRAADRPLKHKSRAQEGKPYAEALLKGRESSSIL